MSIEVWWGSGSPPSWRVLLGLAVKGLDHESHLLSFSEGDLRKPEFKALNPRGKVPVARKGGFTLHESLAILAWLDRRNPEPPLFGRTAEEHGLVWMHCLEYENHGVHAFSAVYRPLLSGKGESEAGAIRTAVPLMHGELARLEAAVARGAMVGEELSAADLVWFVGLQGLVRAATRPSAARLGLLPLGERYPALLAWARRIEALPGYDEVFPPHWLTSDPPSPRRLS
jgi:glutathione S-transferase